MQEPKNHQCRQLVDKDYLSEIMGVSPRTVENWVRRREIPFIKVGRNLLRFDLDEIDAWIAERVVPIGGRR